MFSMMICPLVVKLLMVKTLLPDAFPTYVFAKDSELGVDEISVVCPNAAIAIVNKRKAENEKRRVRIFIDSSYEMNVSAELRNLCASVLRAFGHTHR